MSTTPSGQPLAGWLEPSLVAAAAEVDAYSDRVRAPADTVRDLRPFLKEIGITRLAEVTGLDRIGIPVWMAIRPNAATLSVSQGKGIDDDSARASALMEATELAVAEGPIAGAITASRGELEAAGRAMVETKRFLHREESDIARDEPMRWLEGVDLIAERAVLAPEAMGGFAGALDQPRYVQTSDGLASGNVLLEAAVHGLCERIERDAMALWSFRPNRDVASHLVDPQSFGDPVLAGLAARVANADLRLRLYEVTSNVGVPAYLAVIAPRGEAGDVLHLEMASGSGCHPVPVRAAIRAVTEAAQTRLTTISGARDDIGPGEYRHALAGDLAVYLEGAPDAVARPSPGYAGERSLDNYLLWIVQRLKAAGIRSAVIVPLGGEDFGIAVAKTIVADLEDSPRSGNRRPGRRALRAMMGAR